MIRRRRSVLLDVDGVLADFAQATLDIVFELTGKRYPASQVTTWEVFDSLPDELHLKEAIYDRLKAKGGCYAIPLYDGAKEGVAALRKVADVTILTSPFFGAETWVHEREAWLMEHFGFTHHDFIHARKKFRVHGDILIDDKPEHIEEWVRYWGAKNLEVHGFLWATERTDGQVSPRPDISKVYNWPHALRLIEAIA